VSQLQVYEGREADVLERIKPFEGRFFKPGDLVRECDDADNHTFGMIVAASEHSILVLWSAPPVVGVMKEVVRKMRRQVADEIDADITRDIEAQKLDVVQ
jgi:hypothetical protein